MSPMTSLVATNRMQQCAYKSISVTASLLYHVGNKTYNYCYCYCYYYYYYFHYFYHYYYYVYDKDAGTCTLTQHILVFRLKLHFHPACQLRLFLIWLVWTGLQFCRDLCSSDHCWGKCNLVISITSYTWKISVAGEYLVLWHRTSTGLQTVHQHLCPTRGPWDLGQL